MKIRREPAIRNLLGCTQQDMAMLLHVRLSQWAMHELGQRPLPTQASQLMSEMVIHAQLYEKKAKSLPPPNPSQLKQQHKKLESLLLENKFRQMTLSGKIAALAKKQAAQLKLMQRVDFLNSFHAKNENAAARFPLHRSIASHAAMTLQTDHSGTLMLHELRLEVLAFEKTLLESKMTEMEKLLGKNDGK